MPSRGVSLAIILSWIAMTGWLLWHDVWPYWKPGQPPWYDVDIVDEAQTGQPQTYWEVKCDDHELYQAQTRVEYEPHSDLFFLHGILQRRANLPPEQHPSGLIRPRPEELEKSGGVFSTCVVNRDGKMVSFHIKVEEVMARWAPTKSVVEKQFVQLFPRPGPGEQEFLVHLEGSVQEDQLVSHVQVQSKDTSLQRDLGPLPLSHFGAVLMPFLPLHRIEGLRPGQRWSVPVVHPLRAALAVKPDGEPPLQLVEAQVLTEQEVVNWENRDRPCLIIEYQGAPFKGKDVQGRIWVEQDSGRVLKQTWDSLWGQKWEFQRRAGVPERPLPSTKR